MNPHDSIKSDKAGRQAAAIRDRAQHTPGPWQVAVQTDETGRNYYVQCLEATAGGVQGWGMAARTCGIQSMPEKEANARIIAAAPEMLEALRQAHSAISDLATIDHPVARSIYDLIAKATGGES